MRYKNPASTVDLIIPYNGKIVFVRRKNNPFKGYLSLPGGFLDYGKETLEQAATRELKEETGLSTRVKDLKLIGVYSSPNRDPRGHVISHAYEVKNFRGKLRAGDDAEEVIILDKIPDNLAFDHNKILNDYFTRKKENV